MSNISSIRLSANPVPLVVLIALVGESVKNMYSDLVLTYMEPLKAPIASLSLSLSSIVRLIVLSLCTISAPSSVSRSILKFLSSYYAPCFITRTSLAKSLAPSPFFVQVLHQVLHQAMKFVTSTGSDLTAGNVTCSQYLCPSQTIGNTMIVEFLQSLLTITRHYLLMNILIYYSFSRNAFMVGQIIEPNHVTSPLRDVLLVNKIGSQEVRNMVNSIPKLEDKSKIVPQALVLDSRANIHKFYN